MTERFAGATAASLLTASASDEMALVTRVRGGDKSAFETLFHAYYPLLHAFVAGYVRAPDVAEEIVQDVFFNIWATRENWVVRDGVRSYLYGAARNRALGHLRHDRVVTQWETNVAQAERPVVGAASDAIEAVELQQLVTRAIAQLPDRRREAYLLRWQHHMSYAEIAKHMGISIKGVEMALAKALQTLRDELRGHL